MLRIFNHSVSKVVSGLVLVELIILLAAVYVGAAVRFMTGHFQFAGEHKTFFLTALSYADA